MIFIEITEAVLVVPLGYYSTRAGDGLLDMSRMSLSQACQLSVLCDCLGCCDVPRSCPERNWSEREQ